MSNLNEIFGHDIYIDRERQALTAANGEYVVADGPRAATQDILLRIITPLGALFYDKEFGSTVPLYIHDESTPANRMSLKAEIIRRIEMDSRVLNGTVTAEILKWDEKQIIISTAWVFWGIEEPGNLTIDLKRPAAPRVIEDISL